MIESLVLCALIYGAYVSIKKEEENQPTLKEGDYIELTHLPACRNAPREINPYIGMRGWVNGFDGERFDLFTGHSWLIGVEAKKCLFNKI